MALVVALATIGLASALWSKTLTVDGSVATGTVSIEFVNHVDMQLEGTARDSHSYWLGMRARLFGPGSNENTVRTSACPPQNDTPDSANAAK